MRDKGIAKLFKYGGGQAVRLPKGFRMPGTEVRVRRIGRGVLLEPIGAHFDVKAWRRGLPSSTSISMNRSCQGVGNSLRITARSHAANTAIRSLEPYDFSVLLSFSAS
jgi:virulence-associated protein VagC